MEDDDTTLISSPSNYDLADSCIGLDSQGERTDVDEVIVATGPCGIYQFLLLSVCMFFSVTFSTQTLITYYSADNPPWKCISNHSSVFCNKHFGHSFATSDDQYFKQRCKLNRSEWDYVTSKKYSIVTDYDLVCSKDYVVALLSSTFFIGAIFGSIVFGIFADIYGRKKMICVALFLLFGASCGCSFTTAVWQLMILRVVIGTGFAGAAFCTFILLTEFTAPNFRVYSSNIYMAAFSISMMLLSLTAFYVREWRKLTLYTSIPLSISFFLSFTLHESPRWLNSKGHMPKAKQILEKVKTWNKKSPDFDIQLNAPQLSRRVYSYIDLFKNCRVLILVLAMMFLWFGVGIIYYGIALESSSLGGSIYFNFVMSSLADIPSYFIPMYICVKFGRKKASLCCFGVACVFIVPIAFVPENYRYTHAVKVTLAICSKIIISTAMNIVNLWTFELFPTVVRSQGMNVCQFATRVGSSVAPFLTDVLQMLDHSLPFYIMGGISFLSALIGSLLQETKDQPTRDDYQDFFKSKQTPEVESVSNPIVNS